MGLTHVAQPSYSALQLEIGDFILSVIRCCVRAGGLSGLPSSSDWCGGRGATALPFDSEVLPSVTGYGRNKLRPSRGFGPVAGARCRPPLCVSFFLLLGSFHILFLSFEIVTCHLERQTSDRKPCRPWRCAESSTT